MPRTSIGFARIGLAAALLGILASTGFLAAGCGDDDDPAQPAVDPFFPRTVLADYVEVRDCRNSIDHAGQVRVYANPGAAADYVEGNYPLAEGSVIVKPRTPSDSSSVTSVRSSVASVTIVTMRRV